MTVRVFGKVLVVAAALAVAACASTGSPDSSLKPENGYRLVKKDGKDFYCTIRVPTGSHTNAEEHCMTPAMFDAMSRAPTQNFPPPPSGPP